MRVIEKVRCCFYLYDIVPINYRYTIYGYRGARYRQRESAVAMLEFTKILHALEVISERYRVITSTFLLTHKEVQEYL